MQMIQLSSTLSCQPWKTKCERNHLCTVAYSVTFHSNPHQRQRPSFWTSSKSDHSIFSYNLAVTITDRPNIYLPVRDKLSYCPWADNLKIMKTSCPALQTGTPVSRIPTTCREVNISFVHEEPPEYPEVGDIPASFLSPQTCRAFNNLFHPHLMCIVYLQIFPAGKLVNISPLSL